MGNRPALRRDNRVMDLRQGLTPALLAYEGIQYRYMAPGVFTEEEFSYVQERLRILSGFYGLLRPFDGVVPYRLEMQAKLAVAGARDLYAFWGDTLALALAKNTDVIFNLASKEYSRSVIPHLPAGIRLVSCVFWRRTKRPDSGKGDPLQNGPRRDGPIPGTAPLPNTGTGQAIWRLGLLFFSGTLRREYLCFYQKGRLPCCKKGKKLPCSHCRIRIGNPVNLSDFAGKKELSLYFYPRDNTTGLYPPGPVLSRQSWEDYSELGAVVIGISKDSVASHQKFAQKFHLPFLLCPT